MKKIAMPALICIAAILSTATSAPAAALQDCNCPTAYAPTYHCNIICAAEPVKKDLCPKGADYDDNLDLCTTDPGNDGQCPKGMTRPLYKQKCTSQKRTNEYACPPGGLFDKDKGYCTTPCMIKSDSQAKNVEGIAQACTQAP